MVSNWRKALQNDLGGPQMSHWQKQLKLLAENKPLFFYTTLFWRVTAGEASQNSKRKNINKTKGKAFRLTRLSPIDFFTSSWKWNWANSTSDVQNDIMEEKISLRCELKPGCIWPSARPWSQKQHRLKDLPHLTEEAGDNNIFSQASKHNVLLSHKDDDYFSVYFVQHIKKKSRRRLHLSLTCYTVNLYKYKYNIMWLPCTDKFSGFFFCNSITSLLGF